MRFRKFFAAVLALSLVLSLPFSASAAQPQRGQAAPTAATCTELTVNVPAQVTISTGGDVARFRFVPDQTSQYTVWMEADASVFCFILNASGDVLYLSDGQEHQENRHLSAILTKGETYFFETGYNSEAGTGSYSLSLSLDGMPHVTPIQLGEEVQVALPGGSAYYAFTPGQAGTFTLAADSNGEDTLCCLFDENWNRIGFADDTGENRDFTLTADLLPGRTYYFEVRFYHNDAGSFRLRLSGDTVADLRPGEIIQVRITAQNPSGYYCFVPQETGWYALTANSNGMDTICSLYDAQGNFLQESDMGGEGDDFSLVALLNAGEAYFYQVQYFGSGAEGTFEILLNWLGAQENLVLTPGESVQAKIYGAGLSCYCSFTPDNTGYYMLRADSLGENTVLWLYDEEGNYLAVNDDNPEGTAAALMHYLTAGTTYIYETAYYDSTLTGGIDLSLRYVGEATPSGKLENGMDEFFEVSDLVPGEDGIYRTPEGKQVYIAVHNRGDYGISVMDRFTLLDMVIKVGHNMDLTHWDALTASMDDEGYVLLTEQTLQYAVTLLTGNPALGAREEDVALLLFYDAAVHVHSYEERITEPTCTERGYTTHTCTGCGHTYRDSCVEAPGHRYEDGICTGCGKEERDFLPGDVNGDGTVDTTDAYLIVMYYNERMELTEEQLLAADVDGNGDVDTTDAYYIVMYYNEWIDRFPGEF